MIDSSSFKTEQIFDNWLIGTNIVCDLNFWSWKWFLNYHHSPLLSVDKWQQVWCNTQPIIDDLLFPVAVKINNFLFHLNILYNL